jgi:hypothetical protein
VDVIRRSERYMVHDVVWAASGLAKNDGKLCVGCLEQRIGRPLEPGDFTDCLGNQGYWRRSRRLDTRMTQQSLFSTPTSGEEAP